MIADLRQAYLEMRRTGADRFTPEFLEYVYRFIFGTSLRGHEFQHLSAADLCSAFPRQMLADFGPMAGKVLERWGLRTFAELGEAVFLLAEKGCLSLHEKDSREDYAAAGPIPVP